MRIETGFDISRPPAEAYALLLDLERVTPCFPGAELAGPTRPTAARDVRVTVRLGPMRLAYEGDVRIAERDDAALRAVLAGQRARGARRGLGDGAHRHARRGRRRGARVVAEADVDLTGRAAQMGAGIVEDVATRLVGEMAGLPRGRPRAPASRGRAPRGRRPRARSRAAA